MSGVSPPSGTAVTVAVTVGFLLACCPIPLKRQVSVVPAFSVTVQQPDGSPAPGAVVTARRVTNGPPPTRETHRWSFTADAQGAVAIAAIEQSETYMPLMMHGVEWYAWDVCAVHPGGAQSTRHRGRVPVESPASIALTLDPALKDCGWQVHPPPP